MRLIGALLSAALLAGCATHGEAEMADAEPEYVEREAGAESKCDAEPAQQYVGYEATQAMGAMILQESGAATLRWGPPDSAWTMDYRLDRVNVRYDRDMKITAVSCG